MMFLPLASSSKGNAYRRNNSVRSRLDNEGIAQAQSGANQQP